MTIYNAPLLSIDKAETKRYAGLGTAGFDEKIINAACLDVQIQSTPNGIWQIYDYDASSGEIQSVPPAYIKGNKIRQHLKNAEKIVFLAITIGDAVEAAVTYHFAQGAYAYSLFLDAAATSAVESAADSMEKTIHQYLSKCGYQALMRFSPGYGDWDITFQSEMLRLSQSEKIHIGVTESSMLIPRKSITAMIGAIPNQAISSEPAKKSCETCKKKDCLARKES